MVRRTLVLFLALSLSACWQSPSPIIGIDPRAGLLPEGSSLNQQSLGGTSDLQFSEYGKITLSVDGLGTNESSGIISVEKPSALAKVRRAFLAVASVPGKLITDPVYVLPQDGIKLDGVGINNWLTDTNSNNGLNNAIKSKNYFKEVTGVVRTKLNAAAPGRVNFTIEETSSKDIDGEILAVIFDDPSQTSNNTVVLMFGSQETDGDKFNLLFASPIKKQANFRVDFSLGISYSARNKGTQNSSVDIVGFDASGNPLPDPVRLTTDAGGADDGLPVDNQNNGALLTVGGLDDSNDNPADPYFIDRAKSRNDDELYNLAPFLKDDDTRLRVETNNISHDDNIFFAAFSIVGASAVVNDGITLAPVTATNPVGTTHTVTATIQDLNGTPPNPGKEINFEIIKGPNLNGPGSTGSMITDAKGQASFTYKSNGKPGTDVIEAYYVIDGAHITANQAFKTWIYPEQITLEPPEKTLPAGTNHTVIATITNTISAPTVGREVTFTVISGPHAGVTGTGTTDSNGKATFTYPGPNVGTDTIQAKFTDNFAMEKPSNTVKVNWFPTQAITLAPATASNSVGTQHTITATVTDSQNHPVVNTDVTITVQSGPHAGTTATVKTDSSGQAKLTYPGTSTGTDVIGSSFVDNFGTTKNSNTVEAIWTLIEKIKLEPLTATSVIGTNHTVTATLEDGLARPLVGRTVTFVVNSGPNAGKTGTGITDGTGKASYTYLGNLVGTDVIGSSFMSTNAGVTNSNTVQKIWTGRNKTQIKCSFEHYGKTASGNEFFEVRVQDSEVGINAIRIITQTNMNVILPNFTPGTRDSQIIKATQINKALSTVLTIEITNGNGETLTCDPAATLAVREKGRPVSETFNNVLHDEGTLRLSNGTPGLKRLEVTVNGIVFVLENLVDGEVRYLNILSALHATDDNVVTVKASGVTGASGDVLIWDGK
jgi:Bacterial Ig-like domain (group 1)